MRIGTNLRTGEKVQLTSWKSPSDPSIGSFSCGLDVLNIPEMFVWNDSRPYWRTGPWNGLVFIGIPEMNSVYLNGFTLVVNKEEETSYLTSAPAKVTVYLELTSQGILQERYWSEEKNDWLISYRKPIPECDVYGRCGALGSCNSQGKPICSCLRGFEPKNIKEWNGGNWTSGCVRRKPRQCERMNKTGEVSKQDGFLKLQNIKVPDFAKWESEVEEGKCSDQCRKNCSCTAYAYDVGIDCMTWRRNLFDIQKFSFGGKDLYIRMAHSELDEKDTKVIIMVPVIIGIITIAICLFFCWRWMAKHKANDGKKQGGRN